MKTTLVHGLHYPERNVDRPDLPSQLQQLDADVNAAMDGLLPDSGVVTGDGATTGLPVTPASGWSVNSVEYRTVGVKMWLYLQFTRTGAAITASSAGNIGDTDVATIGDTAHRPAIPWYGIYRATTTSGAAQIDTTGLVRIVDAHSGSTISTGDIVRVYAPYTIPAVPALLFGATDRGLYFPASTDRPIGDNDVTQIALTAESIDAKLSALVPDTGTVNTGVPVTPAAGWEILLAEYRAIGKDMWLHVWLKRTGAAITADSAGNVAGDPDLFTITDPALCPSINQAIQQFRASFTGGASSILNTGLCQMYDAHSGSTIAAPTSETYHTLQVYANYPIP